MKWLGIIGSILVMFFVYLLIKAMLIGIGIGVGFLLTWLLPSLDFSFALLIGVLATGMSMHFYGNFLRVGDGGASQSHELDEVETHTLMDILAANSLPGGTRFRRPKSRWRMEE